MQRIRGLGQRSQLRKLRRLWYGLAAVKGRRDRERRNHHRSRHWKADHALRVRKADESHLTMKVTRFILASVSFTAGLFVGAAILLPILAHAAEYTAVGRDTQGEMVLVEFDEADRNGNLSGIMWRRMEVVEVDGRLCGKGLARFEGIKVEVVK